MPRRAGRSGLPPRRREQPRRHLDEERVARDVHPLYREQGENLQQVLADLDAAELAAVARFLERMSAGSPTQLP